MSTLSVPNTFVSGAVVTAAGHNQNWTAVSNWAAGGIGEDNLDTLSGTVTWSIASNVLGINMTNSGTEGVISVTNNANLAASKAVVKITQNNTGPALQVDSTTAPVRLPRMTTAQRDLISAVEGDEIYNTSLKRKEIYNGSYWVSAAGDSGQIVAFPGSTLPAYLVECDGSTLANNGTNAYARNVLGSTWGATGQLPDLRGRTVIGAGSYTDSVSGSVTRTLGTSLGAEKHVITIGEMAAHDHGGGSHNHTFSGTTSTNGAHTHNPGSPASFFLTDTGGAGILSGGGAFGGVASTASNGDHTHTYSGTTSSTSTISSQGSGTAHNNMQPSAVVRLCMVL